MKIIDKLRKVFVISILPMVSLSLTSCSNIYIYKELKDSFTPWYNSLTYENWNRDSKGNLINYHCDSETQAITMYANNHGNFWNEYLHKQQEPKDLLMTFMQISRYPYEIRGSDYKYIDSALSRAVIPFDLTVYHAVEYMEVEFYTQLQDYITFENNEWNYNNCIGKTITSYGYISTTFTKELLANFFGYEPPLTHHIKEWNPLKEKTIFVINIKKNYQGAAYLADFVFNGFANNENQLLIKRNSVFKITNVDKVKDFNIFYVDLIQ